jgi:hypothetical protein
MLGVFVVVSVKSDDYAVGARFKAFKKPNG